MNGRQATGTIMTVLGLAAFFWGRHLWYLSGTSPSAPSLYLFTASAMLIICGGIIAKPPTGDRYASPSPGMERGCPTPTEMPQSTATPGLLQAIRGRASSATQLPNDDVLAIIVGHLLDRHKIDAIKACRELTLDGLREAKDLVDAIEAAMPPSGSAENPA
jgi:hypothetical protein